MHERRWGVVGAGRVARRFAKAIGETSGHRVAAVSSRTRAGASSFVDELGFDALATDSLDELLDAAPDLVYIASPNDLHAVHVALVHGAGVAVLCEKPLAANAAGAREIRNSLGSSTAPVGVAFQYRQHPAHARARGIVASGALGDVRLVEVSACLPALDVPPWYDDPEVSGGGILPMSGVHRVDIARHIVGQGFTRVQALVDHHRGAAYDDTAAMAARFAGGAAATFLFGLDAPFGDDRLAIHGTLGSVLVDSTMSQWWSDTPGTITLRTAEGTTVETFDDVDTYGLQVRSFARFADGLDEPEFATVDDAVACAEFSEGVYESARSGASVAL
ncbi:MAG: oxidoreductase domain protein [Microbacteriaceae bacterium]|jgi:predicted dehydrogenase|nr:oxidoreductase domain protein [Microbacteriaceae bacterium]